MTNITKFLYSSNGSDFEPVGIVLGNGTTSEFISYSLIHDNPIAGMNYYQLKQVDYDGAEVSYEIIKVENTDKLLSMDITVYPNPTTVENLRLRVSSLDKNTPISVVIIDINGRAHYQKIFRETSNLDSEIKSSSLIPGIYYLLVKQGANVKRKKVVIR